MKNRVRPPAVAGMFYSDVPSELSDEVERFCQRGSDIGEVSTPSALVVPHAGYYYSGAVAGKAYQLIKGTDFKTVILLGPNHRVPLHGAALSSADTFSLPTGNVVIGNEFNQVLIDEGLAQVNDLAHAKEHSLEVQLPFIHHLLPNVRVVPLVVGQCISEHVTKLLQRLVTGYSNTDGISPLIIVSTDLSHFRTYHAACDIDNNTIARILAFKNDLTPDEACGCYALNGVMRFFSETNTRIELVSCCNSGDVSGDKSRVVGYASFVLH